MRFVLLLLGGVFFLNANAAAQDVKETAVEQEAVDTAAEAGEVSESEAENVTESAEENGAEETEEKSLTRLEAMRKRVEDLKYRMANPNAPREEEKVEEEDTEETLKSQREVKDEIRENEQQRLAERRNLTKAERRQLKEEQKEYERLKKEERKLLRSKAGKAERKRMKEERKQWEKEKKEREKEEREKRKKMRGK